jgi:hypothetical protein
MTRLTLLILCDQSKVHSRLFSAFLSSDFEIIAVQRDDQAAQILSVQAVDAILIRHADVPDPGAAATELKRMAPRTPILLLADERAQRSTAGHAGIDSVCFADFQQEDESVMRAIAFFFRYTLTVSRAPRASHAGEPVRYRRMSPPTQIAV